MSFMPFDSFQSLKSYCDKFDNLHGCKTIFTTMTLNYLREFLNKPYENDYVDQLVEQMFAKQTVVFSNDLTVPESPIGKLNSFYLINLDLINKKKFYSPISLTMLPSKFVLHPGSTRLLYSHLYNDPVSIMITDYRGTGLLDSDDFNFIPEQSVLHCNHSRDSTDPYIPKKYQSEDCWFKQLVDSKIDRNNFSFHVPRNIKPPRIFQLKHKLITANDMPILRYSKKHWRIVLE